jgi:hypothetical protein
LDGHRVAHAEISACFRDILVAAPLLTDQDMRSLSLVLTAILLGGTAAYAQDEPREAVPRGSRPQGDNPQTGTAVPRGAAPRAAPAPAPPPDSARGVIRNRSGRTVVVQPPPVYGYRYSPYPVYPPYASYPYAGYRRSYPYGYGSFGLGFLYYDAYRWYPGTAYPGMAYPGTAYVDPYRRPLGGFSTFDIGELRLDVSPRQAQVYVDGYFAGTVDDFDGAFQAIRLAPGAYRIDIVAPGYETLTFDVRITPGQKIRYRGELYRR